MDGLSKFLKPVGLKNRTRLQRIGVYVANRDLQRRRRRLWGVRRGCDDRGTIGGKEGGETSTQRFATVGVGHWRLSPWQVGYNSRPPWIVDRTRGWSFPKLGASAKRMLLGMTVLKTSPWKKSLRSDETWRARLVRSSNIVKRMPSTDRDGCRLSRRRSMVSMSCEIPSSAKNSH